MLRNPAAEWIWVNSLERAGPTPKAKAKEFSKFWAFSLGTFFTFLWFSHSWKSMVLVISYELGRSLEPMQFGATIIELAGSAPGFIRPARKPSPGKVIGDTSTDWNQSKPPNILLNSDLSTSNLSLQRKIAWQEIPIGHSGLCCEGHRWKQNWNVCVHHTFSLKKWL